MERREVGATNAFGAFLVIGLVAIGLPGRDGRRCSAAGVGGRVVLVRLPEVPLPAWAAGVRLGGPVTLEGLLAAAYDGLRLATILACLGAANALASPRRLLRYVPAHALRGRHGGRRGADLRPAAGRATRGGSAPRAGCAAARGRGLRASPGWPSRCSRARSSARWTWPRRWSRAGYGRRGAPRPAVAPTGQRADAGRPARRLRRALRRCSTARPRRCSACRCCVAGRGRWPGWPGRRRPARRRAPATAATPGRCPSGWSSLTGLVPAAVLVVATQQAWPRHHPRAGPRGGARGAAAGRPRDRLRRSRRGPRAVPPRVPPSGAGSPQTRRRAGSSTAASTDTGADTGVACRRLGSAS